MQRTNETGTMQRTNEANSGGNTLKKSGGSSMEPRASVVNSLLTPQAALPFGYAAMGANSATANRPVC